MTKKLSIITITYNNAEGLKQTMESVAAQTWGDFEHIVVDGNSTDNSVAIIKSFDYKNLIWVSESDSGIYNAMNKGINRASGKYVLFLNSGDYLENEKVLTNVLKYLSDNFSVLSGHMIFNEDSGKRLREHPNKMTFSYLVGNAISHPSTFIKRELFVKYGFYDEEFKVVSDWAFFLKVLGIHNESYLKIPLIISVFDTKGVSSNIDNLDKVYKEREKVLASYFPRVFNNENDTYIFNKFIETNKRFRYLQIIDNYPFFRKIATLKLGAMAWLIKLFYKKAK
ncbi:glycosyltransferase family 2 protein [Winogradskyella sp. MIT101101]|uniref:glycosyltransferase family 2 protein n=1 Tax=Winogradskyella sp. MIT101101 TaxID=3098297 RepID=UPI00399C0A3E